MVFQTLLLSGIGGLVGSLFGGSGSGTKELVSRNELPINAFGYQNIDKSTLSEFNISSPQNTSTNITAPFTQIISDSPYASASGSQSLPTSISPTQTTSPTFIPTGAGGEYTTVPSTTTSEGSNLLSLLIVGAVIGGAGYLIFRRKK